MLMAPSPEQRSTRTASSKSSSQSSKKRSWIPEKICQVSKNRLVGLENAWVDDRNAISEQLASIVAAKAFALRLAYVEHDLADEDESLLQSDEVYHGQVGLIQEGTWPSGKEVQVDRSPCRMWTARHNVTTEETNGVYRKFKQASVIMDGHPYVVDFDEALRDEITEIELAGCTSHYGIDMCNSSKCYTRRLFTENSKLFHLASNIPPLGAKIGIAVFNVEEPDPPVAAGHEMFGHKNDTVIHTGEIKEIYRDPPYFLHNINTIESYSGAVVFLLDKDQPDTVAKDDFGKAVAIHAAGHPNAGVSRNIAFLLI